MLIYATVCNFYAVNFEEIKIVIITKYEGLVLNHNTNLKLCFWREHIIQIEFQQLDSSKYSLPVI